MNNKEKGEPIQPIEFVKKEDSRGTAIQPIEFETEKDSRGTAIQPIEFETEKDSRGTAIQPIEFETEETSKDSVIQPIEFLNELKRSSRESKITSVNNQNELLAQNNKGEIVRPQNEEKESDVTELSNYELNPILKKVYKNREGEIEYTLNEIVVQIIITVKGRVERETFVIRIAEIDKITKLIGKRYPSAIIYDKKDSNKIENDFREKTSQLRERICYTEAGWQIINNKHVYLHMSSDITGSEILTRLNLPYDRTCSKKFIADIWYQIQKIYKDHEVSSVMLSYSLLGVLYKVFEEAGFPPHFLLFINGTTGSFKTTISKILYTQLSEDRYRDNPRRIDADTVNSLERALVLSGRDTVTLIDDYCPAKTRQRKSEMENKLEAIIRMVGDGSTKSRSNTLLEDCRGEGIKGVVVLTGEIRGKGLSSNLRCLYCQIDGKKVDLNVVTWFQKNRNMYTTFIQHFANYISNNWANIVEYIKINFDEERSRAESILNQRRLIDSLVTLWIVSDILGCFLIEYCGESRERVLEEIVNIKTEMKGVVISSEILSQEEDPAEIFMEALVTMIENKKIQITTERLQGVQLKEADGFEDDNFVYVQPDNAYSKVTAWLNMGGIQFGADIGQIGTILCNKGYAIPTSNGANKKVYYARIEVGDGRKVKFLKIPKGVIKQFQGK